MATDPPAFARPRPGTQPPPLYPDYASTQKRAPKRPPIRFEHTLSETTGPVFGPPFVTRLNTQMYFPGDPLLAYDPIYQSTADAAARERLIAQYDPELSEPEWALGYRWDMVLRGRAATPMDPA